MIDIWGIKLHAYGLLIGIGVYVAWEMARKFGRIKDEVLEKMFFGLVFFGILGARMYHVIDLWEYYSKNVLEIFYLWNGGLGIWGAICGGIFYLSIFSYFNKLNLFTLLDSVVIGLPLAQAIGRLGNWVNGELYGKNGEPLFAWEAGLNILLGISLIFLARRRLLRLEYETRNDERVGRNDGFIAGVYLIGYGVIRICLENFRPESIIWRIGGVPTAIIFGIVAVVIGIYLIQKKAS